MVSTVEEGSARGARSDLIRIAAKTGTTEIDGSEDVHTWITGFTPDDDGPQAAVAVVVENENEYFGHQTAVESMQSIMEAVVTE